MGDGTLIVYGRNLAYANQTNYWTFRSLSPIDFLAEPHVAISQAGSTANRVYISAADLGAIVVKTDADVYVNWIAIGRWK